VGNHRRHRTQFTVGLAAAETFLTDEQFETWQILRQEARLPPLDRGEAVRRIAVMTGPEFEWLKRSIVPRAEEVR